MVLESHSATSHVKRLSIIDKLGFVIGRPEGIFVLLHASLSGLVAIEVTAIAQSHDIVRQMSLESKWEHGAVGVGHDVVSHQVFFVPADYAAVEFDGFDERLVLGLVFEGVVFGFE